MWPRDDEQRRRGKNTGFVAFMRREDAEKARDALDGVMLRDLQLSLGWGKSVPLPAVPVWPPPGSNATAPEEGAVPAGAAGVYNGSTSAHLAHHHAMPAAPESTRQRMHDGPPPKATVIGLGPDIEVTIPEDHRQRFIIDATAYYVLRDGCELEQVLMEKEANNPEYEFLFDVRSPEHVYYRWRLFSLANGDSLRSWKVDPFLMVEKSNRWTPPPMTLISAAQKSATQRAERREDAPLTELARQKLRSTLQTLTVDRQSICDAMVWILDHADHATEVAEILITALIASESPIILKIAHLFLLSDVLHNTSAAVRNVSRYRNRLQDALPDIFESLQDVYRSSESRMAQELLRKHVLKVLRVWRGWYIFSDDFLNGLQATFLRNGGVGTSKLNSISSTNTNNVISTTAIGGGVAEGGVDPVLAGTLEKLTDDEIELRCKHSGLSRKGGREVQVARILALDTYLNGGERQGIGAGGAVGGGNGGEGEKRGGAELGPSEDSLTTKRLKK
jgi:U2-associated protein SR140